MKQIILTGVGGQGILLASKILSRAALDKSLDVKSSETIGMAQRGGSVVTHIRIAESGEEVFSSMIPLGQADTIIGFEPGETLRVIPYLAEGGTVIASTAGIVPTMTSDREVIYEPDDICDELKRLAKSGRIGELSLVDTDEACKRCGSPKVVNAVLLGVACRRHAIGFDIEQIETAMSKCVAPKFVAMNKAALNKKA